MEEVEEKGKYLLKVPAERGEGRHRKEVRKCEGSQVLRGRRDNFSRAVKAQYIRLGIEEKGYIFKIWTLGECEWHWLTESHIW